MLNDQEFEKFIKEIAHGLQKHVPAGDKARIWLKISARLAATDKQPLTLRASGFLRLFSLKHAWGRAVATLLLVLMALTVARGAAKATPGQTLYPVKRAAEKVEKVLATNEESKAKINIKHAKRRLSEVQILISQNSKQTIVAQTLTELTNTTLDAVAASKTQPELKEQIVELASQEEQILTIVQNQVTGEIKTAVEQALETTQQSLTQLTDGAVEGSTTLSQDTPTSTQQATSTLPVQSKSAQKTAAKSAKPKEEGQIETILQINEVITVGQNNNPVPQTTKAP